MATRNFILRGTNPAKPQSITLIFRYGSQVLKYPTGFKVLPKYWNAEKQTVRNKVEVTDRDTIVEGLAELRARSLNVYNQLVKEGRAIDNETLRQGLNQHKETPTTSRDNSPYIQDFLKSFIDRAPSVIIQKKNGKTEPIRPSTIKQYQTTLNKIKEFDKYRKKKSKFADLNKQFHSNLLAYLKDVQLLTNNTIGSRVKNIKSLAKIAKDQGIDVDQFVFSKEFFKPVEETESVYLSESEIHQIFTYDFSNNEKLNNVRDLLIIACWTGFRISDLSNISEDNIRNNAFEIKQKKTGKPVALPIHYQVEHILEKRNGKFPKIISDQKFNDYVKEVCKTVGLDQPIKGSKRQKIKKGVYRKVTKHFPKYELISSHTGRRSFATNHYGVFPNVVIRSFTGHSDDKQLLNYIKIVPRDHFESMQNYWNERKEYWQKVTDTKLRIMS